MRRAVPTNAETARRRGQPATIHGPQGLGRYLDPGPPKGHKSPPLVDRDVTRGTTRSTLITLHIRYGGTAADRVPELRAIAEWLAHRMTLGDYGPVQTKRMSGDFSSLPDPSVVSATTKPWRR